MALRYPYDFTGPEAPPDTVDALSTDTVDPYLPNPADYQVAPYTPQVYPGGARHSLLEDLAGIENTPLPQAHGLGEGILYGLTRGFGAAGSQALAKRAEFEKAQQARQAEADQERIQASRDYRTAKGEALRKKEGDRLTAQREMDKLDITNPPLTQAQIDAVPSLKRAGFQPGQRLSPEMSKALGIGGEVTAGMTPDQRIAYEAKLAAAKAAAESRAKAAVEDVPSSLYTPEGKKWLVNQIRQGKDVTSLLPGGMGKTGQILRASIVNAVPDTNAVPLENAPAATDVGANRANVKAETANLTGLNKAKGMTIASVAQLDANSQMLLGLQKKIADLGLPVANKPVRDLVNNLGSDDQAAYNTALAAVHQEAARVWGANFSGAGQVHESDKAAVRAVIRGDFNGKQMEATLKVLWQEGKNRVGSLDAAIKAAQETLSPANANAPAPAKTYGGIDPMQFVKKGK